MWLARERARLFERTWVWSLSTHVVAHNCLYRHQVPGNPMPSALSRHCVQNTHTHKIRLKGSIRTKNRSVGKVLSYTGMNTWVFICRTHVKTRCCWARRQTSKAQKPSLDSTIQIPRETMFRNKTEWRSDRGKSSQGQSLLPTCALLVERARVCLALHTHTHITF